LQVDKWNPGWAQPERVIKRRQVTDGGICRVEWLVKWTGLGYEQCTWEPADAGILASPDMSKLFLAYEQWTKAASDRISCKRIEEADRLHNKPLLNLDKQPDWILSGHITSTQLDALNQLREWWHNRMNGILVDEGSQEKMVTTILFILSLVEDFRVVRPTLIVVHVGLLSSWEQELRLWAPKLNLVSYATKNEEARDVIRRVEFNLPGGPFKPDIVLTTFEVLNADMEVLEKVDWEVLIVDEARRPRPQKVFRAFCQLSSVFRLLLLSETLKMNVEELSQCIAFLEPEKSDVMYGQEGALIAELQQQLRGRLREYTPTTPLAEYWVPVELTHVHLHQYCDILVKNFPALSRNRRDQCSTQIQTVVAKLRQV
jgi:chromodomain-helicase-DNA-binding protein 3